MRTSKVIAVSVPPQFEREIHKHAQYEHRTVSEYVREAVRKYMDLQEFSASREKIAKRVRKKGFKPSDVEEAVEEIRKKG